jgi:hypothetical protein
MNLRSELLLLKGQIYPTEAAILSNYKIERAQAGFGFEVTSEKSGMMYAIFLDVVEIPPSRGLSIGIPKLARLVDKSDGNVLLAEN